MNRKIISVHTPKVAGTSFLKQLQAAFGIAHVLTDYGDDPADIRSCRNINPEHYNSIFIRDISPYKVVHGHFHPSKYDGLEQALRITFLRHPVDNIQSIFRFWSAAPLGSWDSPIFNYFKTHGLSIECFAALPVLSHLYSKQYFGGFDMNRFNFIGDYSVRQNEIKRLSALLGVSIPQDIRLNVTDELNVAPDRIDESTFGKLSDILADDIEFYNKFVGR
jgi:hypothetical protein